jgi:hypothetical protein
VTELARLHGGELSPGACALVSDEWETRGHARYLAARARVENDSDLARTAATLLAGARQCARDSWQLVALEARPAPIPHPAMKTPKAAPNGRTPYPSGQRRRDEMGAGDSHSRAWKRDHEWHERNGQNASSAGAIAA